jgi:hypothetical protein
VDGRPRGSSCIPTTPKTCARVPPLLSIIITAVELSGWPMLQGLTKEEH